MCASELSRYGRSLAVKLLFSLVFIDHLKTATFYFLQENSGYKEALLLPFEQDDQWDKLLTPGSINPKKQKVKLLSNAFLQLVGSLLESWFM